MNVHKTLNKSEVHSKIVHFSKVRLYNILFSGLLDGGHHGGHHHGSVQPDLGEGGQHLLLGRPEPALRTDGVLQKRSCRHQHHER